MTKELETLRANLIALIEAMRPATDEERLAVFQGLRMWFCEHCGQKKDPYVLGCYCQNDE